ncbi:MAG TPA: zinc-dependent alcohol dehydrogenase [Chloroflexia bacterium]|nr:zinc-dependent alcohol dehydrogenase [Chloroflexia bacterium]
MKANCWMGTKNVEVQEVPDPKILNQHDAIVQISSTAICGSDLHMYNGLLPTMDRGDVLGHEFMGEIVEVGREVKNLKVGDRVIVPFPISCGNCFMCKQGLFSGCENTNPNAWQQELVWGHSTAGVYGYSHMLGGYAGGQAEYARVPFADVNPLKIPAGIEDEKVLFLTDAFPTGYFGADNCDIQPGDTIAIWGAGPIGQFATRSAFLLGAERVIVIDRVDYRLQMARDAGAETVNFEETDGLLLDVIKDMTGGRGPDACIDAVGMQATGGGLLGVMDHVKQAVKLETDRPLALREVMMAVRTGGRVSIVGDYAGLIDNVPFGAVMNRGITMRMGQAPVQKYYHELLERILNGDIDPSFVATHTLPLGETPRGYELMDNKEDGCVKVVLKP